MAEYAGIVLTYFPMIEESMGPYFYAMTPIWIILQEGHICSSALQLFTSQSKRALFYPEITYMIDTAMAADGNPILID